MKRNIIYYLSALLFSVLAVSCGQENIFTQEEVVTAPGYMQYNADLSSETVLTFCWDASAPINNGAASFTVQLTKSMDEAVESAEYSETIKSFAPRKMDTYSFTGLEKGSRYYARVRAEFKSGVSEWVYLEEDGLPAVVEAGRGMVDGGITGIFTPQARLKAASAGTLTFEWSATRFEDIPTDLKRDFRIAVYENEACSELVVSWDFLAESKLCVGMSIASSATVRKFYAPAFIFTGLEPDTQYWFKVTDITDPEKPVSSEPLSARTEVSRKVTVTDTPVQEGQYALYEDFDELLWGSGTFTQGAGYSSQQRANLTEFVPAAGENPVGNKTANEYYLVDDFSTQMVLFSTIKKILPTTSLKDWATYPEDSEMGDGRQSPANSVCARAAHIKLGANTYYGQIATPALDNLSGPATVEVSFDAFSTYVRYSRDFLIQVLSDAVVENYVVTSATAEVAEEFEIEGGYEPTHYTFRIANVYPGQRIVFGGKRKKANENVNGFYMDNISVKVLTYGLVELAAPSVTARQKGSDIIVDWEPVIDARKYVVEYSLAGYDKWTVASDSVTDSEYTIKGLHSSVRYDIRVKAVNGGSESAYSRLVTLPTAEAPAPVQKLMYVNESQIGIRWSETEFKDVAEDVSRPYSFGIYTDAACTKLLWSWSVSEYGVFNYKALNGSDAKTDFFGTEGGYVCPGYIFSGLTPSTSYYVKVTDRLSGRYTIKEYKTLADGSKALPAAAAAAGDVLLVEDFNDLKWGGDPVAKIPGYSSLTRDKDSSVGSPSGENPGSPYYLVKYTQDMGLFSTIRKPLASTTLKDWYGYIRDNGNNAAYGLCGMCGIVKYGTGPSSEKYGAYIVSPSISCLSGKAEIEVTVRAAHVSTTDRGVRVAVFPKDVTALSESLSRVIDYTKPANRPVSESEPKMVSKSWESYTFNVTLEPGQRIGVGTQAIDAITEQQIYLDAVSVRLVKYLE